MSDPIVIKFEETPIRVTMKDGEDGRSVIPRGAWSATTAYNYLDIVTDDGSSYIAVKAVPEGTVLSNTTYWQCIASKGDKGDKGDVIQITLSIDMTTGQLVMDTED